MRKDLKSPWYIALVALALIAAACGDDDSAIDTAETEATEESTVPQTAVEDEEEAAASTSEPEQAAEDFGGTLRVIESEQYNLPLIGADAAQQLGLFEERGLDVEILVGQEVAPALASGDVDLGITSPNRLIGGILEGLEVKIVGPTTNVWDQYIIVRSDLGVDSLEEFEGGKLGVSRFGSAGHFSAEKVAAELGWEEGDYEIIQMSNLDGLMAGLRNGTIDAFMWSAQAAFTLEAEGEAVVLGSVGELIGENPLDVIVATTDAIENKPAAVRTFCEAFYEAQQTFQDDPALAEQIFVEEWDFDPALAPSVLEAGLPYLSTSPEISEEMLGNMAEATMFTIEGVTDLTAEEVAEMYVSCDSL